ncbi:MAG: lysostaphin resistance A-like protein [Haloarculaceae archaeon]
MPAWAAFVGLTGLIVTAFLALARLSQSRLPEETTVVRPLPHGDPGVGDGVETVPLESAIRGAVSPLLLLVNVALTQGLFGAILAGGAVYFRIPGWALGIPASQSTGEAVAVGLGLGGVLWVANELGAAGADVVGVDYDETIRDLLAPASAGGWIVLLGVVLPVVAGVEEFVFRAALVGATSAAFGTSPWALAVVSAVAFALGHGAQGTVGVVVTGVLGLALAMAFVATGSLLVVVVAHYLVNALELTVHEGLGLDRPIGKG